LLGLRQKRDEIGHSAPLKALQAGTRKLISLDNVSAYLESQNEIIG